MILTQADYPDSEHEKEDQKARRRALDALAQMAADAARLAKKLKTPGSEPAAQDAHQFVTLTSQLHQNLTILETLRDVREWHAAAAHGHGARGGHPGEAAS